LAIKDQISIKFPRSSQNPEFIHIDMSRKILIMPPTDHCLEFYSQKITSCFRKYKSTHVTKNKNIRNKIHFDISPEEPQNIHTSFSFHREIEQEIT